MRALAESAANAIKEKTLCVRYRSIAEKPKDAVQYVCDRCGWTNPDPDHPPRFCPDCGAPFAAADQK